MKLEITRQELKEIYDIACSDWKPRINGYASKDAFSDTILFSEKQVEEMIKASTPEQLPIVKKVFNIVDTFESIKTVEDACKLLGNKDKEVVTLRLLEGVKGLDRSVVSHQELIVLTKALNDKWVANFDDSSQYKYYLWWYLGKDFRLRCVTFVQNCSYVSARLCYKNRELAEYSSKTFKSIWKDYLNK